MNRSPKIKGIKDPFSISPSEMKWRDDAACSSESTSIFFVTPKSEFINSAISLCKSCPVRSECFYEAMSYGYYGIWGGSTEEQRFVLIRTVLNSDLSSFNKEQSDYLLSFVDLIGKTKNTAMADIVNYNLIDMEPNV